MTSPEDILQVQPLPFLRPHDGKALQAIRVRHTAPPGVPDPGWTLQVTCGPNHYDFPPHKDDTQVVFLPEPQSPVDAAFTADRGMTRTTVSVRLTPVRRWTIHLVLHSHTDLGFTAPVSEVAQIHNDNTDRAVQYCRATAHLPEGQRFRWTCEVTWQVQNYIRDRRPDQVEDLMRLIRAGEIGVGAFYSGELTSLLGHEEAVRTFAYAGHLRRRFGIPCDTAMLCDVPGCTSGLVQIMAKSGITSLIVADNNFAAPFLPRTDLPRPFVWQGHDETEVLCWYTDHPFFAYAEGMEYGFLDSCDTVERKLADKLLALEAGGYPYDRYQIQYAFDNERLSFVPAEIVHEWATRWMYPRIVLSTAGEFLAAIGRNHGPALPRRAGDWTDWWGGIVAGFPADMALSRECHARLPAIETLATQVALRSSAGPAPDPRIGAAYDGLLAFDEHSGGGNVWQPKCREDQDRALREGYGFLHSAIATINSLETDTLASLAALTGPCEPDVELCVYNPSGVVVSGRLDIAAGGQSLRVEVRDLPPYTLRQYRTKDLHTGRGPGETSTSATADGTMVRLSSPSCTLTIDRDTGECVSFRDTASGIDPTVAGSAINVPCVYLVHPVCEIALGKHIPQLYDGTSHPGEFLPFPQQSVPSVTWTDSPAGTASCTIEHRIAGYTWLRQHYRVDDRHPGMMITNTLMRACVSNPVLKAALKDFLNTEGLLYFHFPFSMRDSAFEYEATGGILRPAEEQLPGSCHDFLAVQRWCALRNETGGILLTARDAPLIDVGSPGLLKFKNHLDDHPQALFVRAVTLRDWGGPDESPYTSGKDFTFRFGVSYIMENPPGGAETSFRAQAHRRAVQESAPLLHFIPDRGSPSTPCQTDRALLTVSPDTVEILVMKPAESGAGWIIRLREAIGEATEVRIAIPGFRIHCCHRATMTEEPVSEVPCSEDEITIPCASFAIVTLLVELIPWERHG